MPYGHRVGAPGDVGGGARRHPRVVGGAAGVACRARAAAGGVWATAGGAGVLAGAGGQRRRDQLAAGRADLLALGGGGDARDGLHDRQEWGSGVVKGLLDEDFADIVTSDRYTAYLWLGTLRRQLCWAHLKRDFTGLVDRGGAAKEVGQPALDLVARLFTAWHQARSDPATWEQFPETMRPIQEEFRTLLETDQSSRSDKAAGLCRALLTLWPALWSFVTIPGVQPTNNAAERAIRPAVLWRKQSLGTKTEAGNQFVARMLSVARVPACGCCQQQQRPLLDYLTAVCSAQQHHQPIPSLLPCPP